MASKQGTVDFLVEQMAGAGMIRSRKMFGEYAIYCNDKVVALVCDEQLFVKPTEAGRAFIGEVEEAPPYPGAKNYFLISGENWDDDEWLRELIKVTEKEVPLGKGRRK